MNTLFSDIAALYDIANLLLLPFSFKMKTQIIGTQHKDIDSRLIACHDVQLTLKVQS